MQGAVFLTGSSGEEESGMQGSGTGWYNNNNLKQGA